MTLVSVNPMTQSTAIITDLHIIFTKNFCNFYAINNNI